MSGGASPGQFGLWGKETKRDWPLITQDEASRALAAFGLRDVTPIEWHSARPFSAVSRLSDDQGRSWFLKRHHHALRDKAALAEEHRLIAHLAERGITVARPLATESGDSVFTLGDWSYECLPGLEGRDLYRDRLSWEPYLSRHQAFESGRALAVFHDAAQSYDGQARPERPLVSSLTPLLDERGPEIGLCSWIASNAAMRGAIDTQGGAEAILTALRPHFRRAAPFLASPATQWGHGDWHGSNLTWHGAPEHEKIGAVFDFSMADRTTRGFDIAVALERSMIDWMNPLHDPEGSLCDFASEPGQITAFLAGYDDVHPLSRREREEIAAFLPLAHVTFACSEIWYYQCLLDLPDLAKTTYDTYLLGHANWFSGKQGYEMLELIAAGAQSVG
ncbi:phosphotransferase [Asaia sp. BMEF1]|uniref:phosphotransferase enzyme family protein n=1 Tax=Asaia sp. BMEF1 TaxID=3155932 RepID=UPI003F661095